MLHQAETLPVKLSEPTTKINNTCKFWVMLPVSETDETTVFKLSKKVDNSKYQPTDDKSPFPPRGHVWSQGPYLRGYVTHF